MKTIVAMLCLFSATSAFADVGLVVTNDTKLYKDASAGKKPNQVTSELPAWSVLLPGPRHSRLDQHVLVTTCFTFKRCGTSFNKDLDQHRFQVLVFVEGESGKHKWLKGWVNKTDVEVFHYEPTFRQVVCSSEAVWYLLEPSSFMKEALLKIDELTFKNFEPPESDNTNRE